MDDTLDPRRALLTRLRYELLLGIQQVPRVTLETAAPLASRPELPAPEAVPKPAASVRAASPQPSSDAAEVGSDEVSPFSAEETFAAEPEPKAAPARVEVPPSAREADSWDQLHAEVVACKRCILHAGRKQTVFEDGDRQAKLAFVGVGPGADEDRIGKPFVGKAGQLLDKIIRAMGLKREEVYICNVVKCRPPGNRTPNDEEILACRGYLDRQLALLNPKVIVALGRPATCTLLGSDASITRVRGQWQTYRGIPFMPTFHPSYVLRVYTEDVRRQVWEDMQAVMEKLRQLG